VLANTLAELAQAAAGAARADDGRLELRKRIAELLGNDAGEGEHGRRPCDLNRIPRLRGDRAVERDDGRCRGCEGELLHLGLLLSGIPYRRHVASGVPITILCNSWMTGLCCIRYGQLKCPNYGSGRLRTAPFAARLCRSGIRRWRV